MSSLAIRADHPVTMTLDEWAEMDEDAEGELVDGRLVEEEEVTWMHDETAAWLVLAIGPWLRAAGGRIATCDVRYGVSKARGRKPDLSVFLPGAVMPPRTAPLVRVPPSIAIEIQSPRPSDIRRDRVEKMPEYAAFGVTWYWLIDPNVRVVEIYRLRPDVPSERVLGATEGKVQVPGCEGLVLDLDDLWETVDGEQTGPVG